MKYSNGLSSAVVHSIHMIVGIYFIYLGYLLVNKRNLSYNKTILIVLGLVSGLYQLYLWFKYPNKNYSFQLPGWLVHLSHVLNGIIYILIALDLFFSKSISGIYLIIIGSLAFAYHAHLWYLKH